MDDPQPNLDELENGFSVTAHDGKVVMWLPRDNEGDEWCGMVVTTSYAMRLAASLSQVAGGLAKAEARNLS